MIIYNFCVNYGNNRFYSSFFKHFSSEHDITVYAPVRTQSQLDNCLKWNHSSVNLYTSKLFRNIDRIFQISKTNKYFSFVDNHTFINSKNLLLHAHSIFSDGSAVYKLHKKYGKNYIITVRNTDINIFWRYFIWRRKLGLKILCSSKLVIVPSHSYSKKLKRLFPFIKDKLVVIPNGVDNIFYTKRIFFKEINIVCVKLVYIGQLNSNKRILRLINIVKSLSNIKLEIYGYGILKKKVLETCENITNCNYMGVLNCVEEKVSIIDNSDIVILPSSTELFGITLAEGIVRGKPIIGIAGEGLDGYFDNFPVGVFMSRLSLHDLKNAIQNIIYNLVYYRSNCLKAKDHFKWENIISKYINKIHSIKL